MNLDHDPTSDQLRDLLRPCDDRAGEHVLWVDRAGEVWITPVAAGTTPDEFRADHPDARLQFHAFASGYDYVGPGAARDGGWVEDLYIAILDEWARAKAAPGGALVGQI